MKLLDEIMMKFDFLANFNMLNLIVIFAYDVIFDKVSKLVQISCVTPHYTETRDSAYLGKIFVNLLGNWNKMRKIIA